MTNTPDPNRVSEVVATIIAEALMVPPEKVTPSARIISDLRAESIDVADIRFRIEEKLGVRIDQREMVAALGTDLSAEEFDARFTVQFVVDYVSDQLRHRE